MKLFIGTVDISSRIRDLTRELNRQGVFTLSAKRTRHQRYVSDVDIVFSDSYTYSFRGVRPRRLQNQLKRFSQRSFGIQARTLRRVINECDAAVFLWSSILDDRSDYLHLRNTGKQIITCFVGSDVRSADAANAEFSHSGFTAPFAPESRSEVQAKLDYISIAESNSNAIFSRPDQAQLQRRPYYRFLPFVTCEDFHPNTSQRLSPVIVHPCSSNPIKGVPTVKYAIDKLKREGLNFDYRRLTNMSQHEVRRAMQDADIVIDQMYLPGGGKVAVEGMASGSVVLTRMEYSNYIQLWPEKPPIVDVNPCNIVDRLRTVIKDVDLRRKLAAAGPEFVQQNANVRDFVDKLLQLCDRSTADPTPDYFPMPLQGAEPETAAA